MIPVKVHNGLPYPLKDEVSRPSFGLGKMLCWLERIGYLEALGREKSGLIILSGPSDICWLRSSPTNDFVSSIVEFQIPVETEDSPY